MEFSGRKMPVLAIILLCVCTVFTVAPNALLAQNSFGSIVGTVTDSSNAVIPGATVTLTNKGTNDQRTVRTGSSGEYAFVNLLPAVYSVEVTAPNLKRFVVESVTVQVDNATRVDATLQVGAVTETVTVNTQPVLLQTDSGTLSYEVEGKQVAEMPLNGRNIMNLIQLVPGVVPQGDTQGGAGLDDGTHTSNTGWNNYQLGGGLSGQSAEYLDGAPLNLFDNNGIGLVPTQDAIQEFRVATSAISPEFGRFGGGVVEMTTKTGSNGWHGSVYEYFRNNIFNANTFFGKIAGTPRPEWDQNQFGGTFSGPIKKDKAFFFFGFERFTERIGIPTATNVPTPQMQAGVFTHAIKDPTGQCAIAQNAVAGTWTVPQSCWDATAAVLKNMWPSPITPNNPGANYYTNGLGGNDADQYNARVDYNLSQKQRLFARFTSWRMNDLSLNIFHNANGFIDGNPYTTPRTMQSVFGDTYTLNPTTLLDVRASYMRFFENNASPDLGTPQAQFGPAFAAIAPQETFLTIPTGTPAGPDGLYSFSGINGNNNDWHNNIVLSGSLTKILGRHTLKMGGEGRYMDQEGFASSYGNSSGNFGFSNLYTGDEFASFLLGEYTTASIETAASTDTYTYEQAYYINDDWQASRKLTINAGVRWEIPGLIKEKRDRMVVLLPNTFDPSIGFTGTVGLVNSSLYQPSTDEPTTYDKLSPRLGFAYRVTPDFVVRGGYSLVFLPPDISNGIFALQQPINVATTTITNNSSLPANRMAQGFEPLNNTILQPVGRSNPNFMKTELNQSVSAPLPTPAYPSLQQWNFTLAKQFRGNMLLQAGYVGSKGTHLARTAPDGLDELPDQYDSMGSALLANSSTVIAGKTLTVGQTLRPFPQFQNFTNGVDRSGALRYDALQAEFQKHFRGGELIQASYTWSKMLDNTDAGTGGQEAIRDATSQDFNNPKAERSIASFNTPQRLVITYVLALPFGQGQRFGASASGVTEKLISGWSVNGITSFESGFPIALSYSGGNALTQNFGAGTLRPNYNASGSATFNGTLYSCNGQRNLPGTPYQRAKNGNPWFNPGCFANPGTYAFGNEPRVDPVLRWQGIHNFDFTASKATKIGERVTSEFKMEFFNVFNSVQFSAPGVAVNGANYDSVTLQANRPRQIQASMRFTF